MGEVVRVEPTAEELADRAHGLEQEIDAICLGVRTVGVELAQRLFAFKELRAWEPLGYERFAVWLAEPPREISYSYAMNAIQVYRALVVERGVEVARLEGVDLRKLLPALPALREGEVDPDEVIYDGRNLGRHDFRAKYNGDPNAPIDPTAEPARVECPACGQWTDVDKLKDAA